MKKITISKLTGKSILGKKKNKSLIQTKINMAGVNPSALGPSGTNTRKRTNRSPDPFLTTHACSLSEIPTSPIALRISGMTEDGNVNEKKIGLDPTNQSPKVTMENQSVRFSVDSTSTDMLDEEIQTVARETLNIQGVEQIEDVF